MTSNNHYIISTDLDGTLLDHYSYDWAAAQPSLQKLADKNIPVIINTSKTLDEVLILQQAMALTAPFIVENGSAAFFPRAQFTQIPNQAEIVGQYWKILLGKDRASVVTTLEELRAKTDWQFESFSDMNVERVIELTGLSEASAQMALDRGFSEPLVWQDSEENYQNFIRELTSRNYRVIKGGRFTHVLGQTDKGKAISWCKSYIENLTGESSALIALGDGPNDNDMLKIADYAVQIKSPTHDYPQLPNCSGEVYQTAKLGPAGWHEAISKLIP